MYSNYIAVSTIVVKLYQELKIQHANIKTMSVSQSYNKLLVKVQILDQRHLVQQTIGQCCPGHTSGVGLVWDHGQEDVQVVLEELKIS